MNEKHTWLITGAGRGMGADIAKAALAAGHAVVATGRHTDRVASAVGEHDDLLIVALDVTDPDSVQAAIDATVTRFGHLDVVVNNAGNFKAGFFEEITPEDFRGQVETVLFGSVNVVRAALPVLRAQRSGLLIQISSTAGIVGGEFTSAYAAAKFGVEGWFESLAPEIAPFGIRALLVEPGFFRTELLTPESTDFAVPSIDDYARRTKDTVAQWQSHERQAGRRPGQARRRLAAARRTRARPTALARRRRRRRRDQAESRVPDRRRRREPRPVQPPRPRRHLRTTSCPQH